MSDLDPVTGRPVTAPGAVDTTTSGGRGQSGATDEAKAKAGQAAGQAKERAAEAGGAVAEHAGQVTESAKAHAAEVTGEARQQVSNLVGETRQQLRSTANEQTDRVAELLQGFGDQLEAMARGEKPPEGALVDLVQDGATRVQDLAGRLRTGGYEMAFRDAQRFARRRPGMFLASAFGAGLLAGRLFRNVDTSEVTGGGSGQSGQSSGGGGQQSFQSGRSTGGSNLTQAEIELSRGGVPAPAGTGAIDATLPGGPTIPEADPALTTDPTTMQGGPR